VAMKTMGIVVVVALTANATMLLKAETSGP
jgi:hypothetical protein